MKKGYYSIECNNCLWLAFWNGFKWIEEDKMLFGFLKKHPIKVKYCFKELEK